MQTIPKLPPKQASLQHATKRDVINKYIDRPLTDLYDTEGTGGFPGITFAARPVVGGHFAFLALERACGGKAVDALQFLNNDDNATGLELKGDENGISGDGEL